MLNITLSRKKVVCKFAYIINVLYLCSVKIKKQLNTTTMKAIIDILKENREIVINEFNNDIHLQNYTKTTLRDYMLAVMKWFEDHSGTARKVVKEDANGNEWHYVESYIRKACSEVGAKFTSKVTSSYSFQMRMAAGDPNAQSRVRIAYGK